MKKIISVILCLSVLLSTSVFVVFAAETEVINESEFAGGSGTEEDPYQVATPEQLNNVRNHLDANFIQINDIDMSAATSEGGIFWNDGNGWMPIGNASKKFTGSYNGAEYSITGLFCNKEYAGLFGYSNGGIIKKVNLTGTIEGGKNAYAGGVVAYNYNGTITNCSFDGTLSTTNSYIGGIVGNNSGTVTNCINNADITVAGTYAGGVIGYGSSSSDITNCYNYGNVTGGQYVGGIIGYNDEAEIKECGNIGKITTSLESTTLAALGGIAGRTKGYITQCFNTGNVSAYLILTTTSRSISGICVGGIVGLCQEGITIKDCFNTGKVSGSTTCGDIVGVGAVMQSSIGNLGGSSSSNPKSKTLLISNCYNAYRNDTNSFYGFNAPNYSYSTSGFYTRGTNVVKISISTSYNINIDKNDSVTHMTESEIKQKDKYVGFDFDTVWNINSAINNGIPYLRNINTSKINVSVNSIYSAEFETAEKISGIIVIALYDDENRLLEVKTYPATDSIPAILDKINSGKYIKVMWWDSISSMKPICENRTIYV